MDPLEKFKKEFLSTWEGSPNFRILYTIYFEGGRPISYKRLKERAELKDLFPSAIGYLVGTGDVTFTEDSKGRKYSLSELWKKLINVPPQD